MSTYSNSVFPARLMKLNQIVALGGGHGLGRVLSSLAFLKERLTGIVTTTDNGGSTGRIRAQQGGIAWGDLRNCLSQIIAKPTIASALFEYRFGGNGELSGHNLGNLILTALENMHIRPLEGMNLVREFLHVHSFLIPMSESPVHINATLHSGKVVLGEVSIDALTEIPANLTLVPQVSATPEALQVIEKAELIILGPGSFFTSILPPLLLTDLAQMIQRSTAQIIFIDNIAKENGCAHDLSLLEKIGWLERFIGEKRLNAIITATDTQPICFPSHLKILQRSLSAEDIFYRHDRQKLSNAINDILE